MKKRAEFHLQLKPLNRFLFFIVKKLEVDSSR